MSNPAQALRNLVPVIGTGFNRWLLDGADASPTLTDWWALLRLTAFAEGLLPDPGLAAKLRDGGAPTFAWEALVLEAQRHPRNAKLRASVVEEKLLECLAKRIQCEEVRLARDANVQRRALRFVDALAGGKLKCRCEVLSLNFDATLLRAIDEDLIDEPAWNPKDCAAEQDPSTKTAKLTIPATYFHGQKGRIRVWHPHGHARTARTMIAGIHRYTRSATFVFDAFQQFKSEQGRLLKRRAGAPDAVDVHNAHRTDDAKEFRTWVATAINAPLLFIGVGLSREEVDLWEFLHLRARNHANVAAANRPSIWRFTSDAEDRAHREHWQSLSGGIDLKELNLGKTWDEAWSALLDLLSSDNGIFGNA